MAKVSSKKNLTAEQLEDVAISRLPSTYSLVTAGRLLAGFGVFLSQASIAKQIAKVDTFYHALMFLPANHLVIKVGIERCRDIQAFGQQKLIHYLFSGEASKLDDESGQNARELIEKNRLKMVDISNDFSSWEEGYIEREKKVFDVLQERVLAWKHTVSEVVNDLINCLDTNLIEIEQDFADQVFINVLESSINIELTKQQFKEYKCPNQLGIIEKTVIYLLDSGSNADLLNASTLKKMRPEFKVLDNKLKSDFDELGGINSECKTQIEAEIKTIDEFSEILEEDVIQISKNLFDYYNEYSSDSTLKVDAGDAIELGVDPTVADDYKALQI